MLTDENAFGFLIAHHDLEDVEYSLEPEAFVERFTEFRNALLARASENPLGAGARIVDLGHALYFEVGDGDHAVDPLTWLRSMRETVSERGFTVTAIATHGGRWIEEPAPTVQAAEPIEGGYVLHSVSRPSEPLRRALYAETATHGSDGSDGWGAGTYVDTELIEALGKSLRNAPTALACAGATFYRIGR